MTAIVLASQSVARRKLLEAAGVSVIPDPANIDESEIKRKSRAAAHSADSCALALAAAKAAAVALRHSGALVIGADQILECDGVWFDKPHDRAEAREQLEQLRGRTHELVSAVVVARDALPPWRHVERSRLTMRAFSNAFRESYLATMGDEVFGNVGGYAFEGLGAQLFTRVEGDYFAILGLPLLPLLQHLRDAGALAR